jgi:hypothetical protein
MSIPLPQTVPFATHPCPCCVEHRPKPLETELHHTFPQADQRRIFGKLLYPATVPLCRTAHRNVHIVLNALLAGAPPPRVNAHTLAVAREGYEAIRRAEAG